MHNRRSGESIVFSPRFYYGIVIGLGDKNAWGKVYHHRDLHGLGRDNDIFIRNTDPQDVLAPSAGRVTVTEQGYKTWLPGEIGLVKWDRRRTVRVVLVVGSRRNEPGGRQHKIQILDPEGCLDWVWDFELASVESRRGFVW